MLLFPRWALLVLVAVWLGFQMGTFHQRFVDSMTEKKLSSEADSPMMPTSPPCTATVEENSSLFFPFTIRDSKRLVPNQASPELEIFDYVDISQPDQNTRQSQAQLFWNAKPVQIGNQRAYTPCQHYSVPCYKQKILQVFQYVLDVAAPEAEYFLYVEADNELCLPMSEYRSLALQEQRYFVSSGVGFSGWIMHRSFMEDFVEGYQASSNKRLGPDIFGSNLLMKNHTWFVTRKYLVSHSIVPSLGAKGLSVKNGKSLIKHLPRCFEPRRGKWPNSKTDKRDMYGWDYFDFDACPDADIYPCKAEQRTSMIQTEREFAEQESARQRPRRTKNTVTIHSH